MTHFRLRWQKLGGHVHVHVWSGTERETTHGRNGSLVFRENEWEDFRHIVSTIGNPHGRIEIIEEPEVERAGFARDDRTIAQQQMGM